MWSSFQPELSNIIQACIELNNGTFGSLVSVSQTKLLYHVASEVIRTIFIYLFVFLFVVDETE